MSDVKKGDLIEVDGGVLMPVETTALAEPIQINAFKRVDFNNPQTILTYGEEPINAALDAAQSLADSFPAEDSLDPEFKKKVDAIFELPEHIEKISKQRDKGLPALANILMRLPIVPDSVEENVKAKRKEKLSWEKAYRIQRENIDEVVRCEQQMMEVNSAHITVNSEYLKAARPLLPFFDEVIALGSYDRDVFAAQVAVSEAELARQKAIDPNAEQTYTQDLIREVAAANIILDTFGEKLEKLQIQRFTISNTIASKDLQQRSLWKLQMSHSDFEKHDAKILMVTATVQIGNEIIKERTEHQSYLIDRMNKNRIENAQTMVDTTKAIVKLGSDGGNIKADTMRKEQKALLTCANIFIKAVEQDRVQRQKHAEEFPVLMSELEGAMSELREKTLTNLIEDSKRPDFKVLGKKMVAPAITEGANGSN